jgi:hypothetical protein
MTISFSIALILVTDIYLVRLAHPPADLLVFGEFDVHPFREQPVF